MENDWIAGSKGYMSLNKADIFEIKGRTHRYIVTHVQVNPGNNVTSMGGTPTTKTIYLGNGKLFTVDPWERPNSYLPMRVIGTAPSSSTIDARFSEHRPDPEPPVIF